MRRSRTLAGLLACGIAAVGLVASPLAAQAPAAHPEMVDPAMDEGPGPFSYYSRPTDAIGVMDGRGTEVTPEGYLYTGYGELMFLAGPTLEPVAQRVRTLREGWLPVVEYAVRRGDVAYRLTALAATLDSGPPPVVADFVRVVMVNGGRQAARARFAFAVRYTGPAARGGATGDNRFPRPATARRLGAYEQPGAAFDTAWTYGFADGAFLRGGTAFYLFPTSPAPELRAALGASGSPASSVAPVRLRTQPTTPTGVAVYDTLLAPGDSLALVVKLPYAPLAPDDPLLARLRAASFDDVLERTDALWHGIAARGMQVALPERKVVDAFRASLVYDLMARDRRDSAFVQTVNQFQYHAFWLRDASFIVRAYDVTGYPDVAAQALGFFARWQQPDGNFVSQGGQYDGWGQALWAYGQHFRLTRDRAFAERVFPAVTRAVAWLDSARAGDSLHLVPSTTPGDNEDITGHVTGHDFWALAGLHGAISLAEGLGRKADAERFHRDYASLRDALVAKLRRLTAATGGYVPPGLDVRGGQDWGNMMAVYPERVLDPQDPMVTATLDSTRAKYAEGVMTYGDGAWLHDYLTMKNTETEVIRGDQRLALEELYAVLLHTSATHAGFETDVVPWGARDFHGNLAPHGWFAACYRTLLRDMLVREAGDTLHLLSVLSPAWLGAGDSVVVRGAPTDFGPVDLRLDVTGDSGAALEIASRFVRPPAALVVHLPWFVDARGATADGRPVAVRDGEIRLAPGARTLRLWWVRRPDAGAPSYDAAVAAYRQEYRRRWEQWIHGAGR